MYTIVPLKKYSTISQWRVRPSISVREWEVATNNEPGEVGKAPRAIIFPIMKVLREWRR